MEAWIEQRGVMWWTWLKTLSTCIKCHHETHDDIRVTPANKMSKSSHVLLVKKTSIEDTENTTQAETADLRLALCSVKAPRQVYATTAAFMEGYPRSWFPGSQLYTLERKVTLSTGLGKLSVLWKQQEMKDYGLEMAQLMKVSPT